MSWSGEIKIKPSLKQTDLCEQTTFNWSQANKTIPGLEEIPLVLPPKNVILSEREKEIHEHLCILVKDANGEGIPYTDLARYLAEIEDPFNFVLKMCSMSNDFCGGKNKGLRDI